LTSLIAELRPLLQQAETQGISLPPSAEAYLATGSSGAPTAVFTRNLSFGMTGGDVQELQQFLIGENTGPAAQKLKAHGTTWNFATLTLNALVEFQKKAGINPASGFFGPITRAYVNAL